MLPEFYLLFNSSTTIKVLLIILKVLKQENMQVRADQ